MSTPELTAEQAEFIIKHTVKDEIHAVEMDESMFDLKLEGVELGAIYILGQMQDTFVRIQDGSRDYKQVGFFHISSINDIEDPDFSNPDDWKEVELNSISLTFLSASTWGQTTSTFSSIFQLKEISRLKEQL